MFYEICRFYLLLDIAIHIDDFYLSRFDWVLMFRLVTMVRVTHPVWMHLRCISITSHTASQRHLKEGSVEQISETSPERLIRDVSLEASLRSLSPSQRHLWVASETVVFGFETKTFFGYLFIYLWVFKHFVKLT